jgi:hypothetical protein
MPDAIELLLRQHGHKLDAMPEHIRAIVDKILEMNHRQYDAAFAILGPALTASIMDMTAAGGTYRLTDDEDITFITLPDGECPMPPAES